MEGKTAFWLGVALHACFLTASAQSKLVSGYNAGIVWVTGFDMQAQPELRSFSEHKWATIFRVYTLEAFEKKLTQSVGGSYAWHDDTLSFKPHFEFAEGETYHVVFASEFSETLETSFLIPEGEHAVTHVVSVHPQADQLPENMLRMYIYFSASMTPGEAYDHIRLQTQDGKIIEKAFLVIDQELWDAERKRFTLLFDPGRVKRGIRSNVELGAPLKAGERYQLIIDSTWRDERGKFLERSYKKSFTVVAAQRTKLSSGRWQMTTPTAGSLDDLLISFDRPVDHALALKYIIVTRSSEIVTGKVTLVNSTRWRFSPDQPWTIGEYSIEVNPLLEDVAGNNLNNPFDIDLSKMKRMDSTEPVKRMFVVGAGDR